MAFNTSDVPVALQAFPALFGGALPVDSGPAAEARPGGARARVQRQRRPRAVDAPRGAGADVGSAPSPIRPAPRRPAMRLYLILYNNDDTGAVHSFCVCRI